MGNPHIFNSFKVHKFAVIIQLVGIRKRVSHTHPQTNIMISSRIMCVQYEGRCSVQYRFIKSTIGGAQ